MGRRAGQEGQAALQEEGGAGRVPGGGEARGHQAVQKSRLVVVDVPGALLQARVGGGGEAAPLEVRRHGERQAGHGGEGERRHGREPGHALPQVLQEALPDAAVHALDPRHVPVGGRSISKAREPTCQPTC